MMPQVFLGLMVFGVGYWVAGLQNHLLVRLIVLAGIVTFFDSARPPSGYYKEYEIAPLIIIAGAIASFIWPTVRYSRIKLCSWHECQNLTI